MHHFYEIVSVHISILQVLLMCPSRRSPTETLILKWRSHQSQHPQPQPARKQQRKRKRKSEGQSTQNSLPPSSLPFIPRYPPTLTLNNQVWCHPKDSSQPMVAMEHQPTQTNRYTSSRECPMVVGQAK